MTRIGFLGLGNMGSAMAARLIAAGHEVTVWNRSPEAAADLVASGATLAASAAEALAQDVSFSMLANDEAAEAVLTVEALSGTAGRIHVNMASISTLAADRLEAVHREAGVGYVAAPVLGRPSVAAAGGLNILVAGPDAAVESVLDLLAILGAKIWRFGEQPRKANTTKIAMNFMILNALEAMGEGIALVEEHGIEAGAFAELFSSTLFGGVVYTGYGSMIAERRYLPAGFTMSLGLKDLSLAESLAAETGLSLPTTAVLRDRFERAMTDPELSVSDWSAVAEVTRRS